MSRRAVMWLFGAMLLGCSPTSPSASSAPVVPIASASAPAAAWAPPPWTPSFAAPPEIGPVAIEALRPDASDAQLLATYTPVWKTLLAQKNEVAPVEVERGVAIQSSFIDHWGVATSVSVTYRVTVDWATAEVTDSMLVRVDAKGRKIAGFSGPVDHWLTADEIAKLAPAFGSQTTFTRIPLGKHLKFPSRAAALAALPGTRSPAQDDRVICRVAYAGAAIGSFLFSSSVTLDFGRNECIAVTLDLVTGLSERNPEPCMIRD